VTLGALLVATDLDGCLLDERTYSWAPARDAVAALRARGTRLVLASSKTRDEMEPLARELGGVFALVVENGGAIVRFGARTNEAERLGEDRENLVAALADIAAETGARVRGFSTLDAAAVSALTGLAPADARRALARRYDEPFLLESGDAAAMAAAAVRRGLRVTRGGRFHHLTGAADKGRALRALLRDLPGTFTVALGDSPNDLTMLQAADRPIVVPRPGGAPDAEVAAALPSAEIAPAPGPEGWNAAVLAVLAGAPLARVGGQGPAGSSQSTP
jgi:mannosyl-3-phosphoglycerate phosphatase